MSSKCDEEMIRTLEAARDLARNLGHRVVTPEHILTELMENASAKQAIEACEADVGAIRGDLLRHLETGCEDLKDYDVIDPMLDDDAALLFEKATIFKTASGLAGPLSGSLFLVAVTMLPGSFSCLVLEEKGVTRYHVVDWIQHNRKKSDRAKEDSRELAFAGVDGKAKPSKTTALQQYATNLNELARTGHIDKLIGRQDEIDRTIKILSRCSKNNPVFVGDAGVGKTAVAEGLAHRIVNKKVPEGLANCVIHALDLTALIAGARYRGDFEERMQEVMKEAMADPNIILFIDEIHTVMGAGSSQNSVDAANILKPALARGKLRCMGATTRKEYRQIFEVDAAMARRFQMVDVGEPSRDEALLILKGLTEKLGKHHHVEYAPEALEAAVNLSVRYLHNRRLPDKAIDVIDEAGAIYSSTKRDTSGPKALVTEEDVRETISHMARIPVTASSANEKEVMRGLVDTLKQSVFGQEKAVEAVSQAIKLAKNGLRDPNKPLASFLFAGPSGVGKTELSRQLAETLGLKLMRFDMSEYMEKHTASRLIGAPPGYVGHGTGGLLTEKVNETPHGVLLLDEIEKAHPDIFNLLLQVMDHGKLTDGNGREVDFRNVVIIMTSNVGASLASKETIGFGGLRQEDEGPNDAQIQALSQAFSPEFRGRLDAVVQFNPLAPRSMGLVVDKAICQMEALLRDKHITVTLTEAARDWISEKGYSREFGARPVEGIITKHIKYPLSDEMLTGSLDNGGNVRIDVAPDGKDLKLICEPVALPALMPAQ